MKIIKAGIVIRLAEYPGSSYHQIRQAYQGKATILCYTWLFRHTLGYAAHIYHLTRGNSYGN